MLDLVNHILTNDSAVTGIVSNNIYAGVRTQIENTPAVVMDWVSTDDLYTQHDTCNHAVYIVELICVAKGYGTCAGLMEVVKDSVNRYRGDVTTSTGNTYSIVNTLLINREIEVIEGGDMVEGTITIEITA